MGAFTVFIWGFLCGAATLVGGATYVYIMMNSGPSEKKGCAQEAQDEETKRTTARILESMGIRPEEIEKLAAGQTVKAASVGPDEKPGGAHVHGDHHKALDDEERDLELEFQEKTKGAKARHKEIKALGQLMAAVAAQTATHAKALEKISNSAELQAQQSRKDQASMGGIGGGSGGGNGGGTRSSLSVMSETWLSTLASLLLQVADEQKRLADSITLSVVDRLSNVQERHSSKEKQLSAEAARVLKDLQESATALATEEKERDRVAGKYEAYVSKSSHSGKSMPEIRESAEYKKLAKKMQDAEAKAAEANEQVNEAHSAFSDLMPRVLRELVQLDEATETHERQLVLSFGELLKEAQDHTSKAANKFVYAMQHYGKADHEVIIEQGMKGQQGTSSDVQEPPLEVDMDMDAVVQLAATNPSKIPPLPPRLVAGIGLESCVWFNAFSGRMYRDASSSVLFHEWMGGILYKLLNKGARPGYIDEFQISDLRFGSLPPLLKNARWVPTAALEEADLSYDIAMVADMVYRGGFGFKVSTKLWLNWPKPGTAHLPIAVDIELEELSGPVRIGVRKHQTYCSFLTEPHTRFTVKSSLGGESNQISNVPKLSSIIISKMKQAIKSKLVHPKAKTFKLLWPRNWWPETAEQEMHKRMATGSTKPRYMPPPDTPSSPYSPPSPLDSTPLSPIHLSTPNDPPSAPMSVSSPMSDRLTIDDAISVTSDGSDGPPTEGFYRRGLLSSGLGGAANAINSASAPTMSLTSPAPPKKSSMSSMFSSFVRDVKTKIHTTTVTTSQAGSGKRTEAAPLSATAPAGGVTGLLATTGGRGAPRPSPTVLPPLTKTRAADDDSDDNKSRSQTHSQDLLQEEEEEDEDAAAEGLDDAELKDQLLQAQASMSQAFPADMQAPEPATAGEAHGKEKAASALPTTLSSPIEASPPSPGMSPEVTLPAAWEDTWDEEHMQPSRDQHQEFLGERHDHALHLIKSRSEPDRLGAREGDRMGGSPAIPHSLPSHVVIESETRKIELQVLSHTMVLDVDGSSDEDGERGAGGGGLSTVSSSHPHSATGGGAGGTQSLPRTLVMKRAKSQGLDGRTRTVVSKALFEQVGHAHMLKRRHSFAGLTSYQARFIEIHADVKDSDDEDEQDEAKAAHKRLERALSKDDSHEYSKRRNHWWTRQLQGVVAKGQLHAVGLLEAAAANLGTKPRTGSHVEEGSDDEGDVFSPTRLPGNMKETKAKMKSLASKLFKSVQTKAAASDFLSLHVASGGAGGHAPLAEQEGMAFSPLPTAVHAHEGPALASAADGQEGGGGMVARHEFAAWVREEAFGGVGGTLGTRKRWARIRDRQLLLFESEKESTLKAVYLLRDCAVKVAEGWLAFELLASRLSSTTTPTGAVSTFVQAPKRQIFHAASEDELMAWVLHLTAASDFSSPDEPAQGTPQSAQVPAFSPASGVTSPPGNP